MPWPLELAEGKQDPEPTFLRKGIQREVDVHGGWPPQHQPWSAHDRLPGRTLAPWPQPLSDCLSLYHIPGSYPPGVLRTLPCRPAPCSATRDMGKGDGLQSESLLKWCPILEAKFLQGYPMEPCRSSPGSLAPRPWHPIPFSNSRGLRPPFRPVLPDKASSSKTALLSASLMTWATTI